MLRGGPRREWIRTVVRMRASSDHGRTLRSPHCTHSGLISACLS